MSFVVLVAKRRRRKGKLVTTQTRAIGPFKTKKEAVKRAELLYKRGYDTVIVKGKIIERKIRELPKRRKKK